MMAGGSSGVPDVSAGQPEVRLHPSVPGDRPFREFARLREGPRIGELFEESMLRQLLCFTNAIRHIEGWPPTERGQAALARTLGFSRITCNDCSFFRGVVMEDELRHVDSRIVGNGALHFYFWISPGHDAVWLLHTCWCRSERLSRVINRLVARRLHQIRGMRHDDGLDMK